jgi:putative transposase
MCETLRFAGRIVSASVARVANHRYASITVETSGLPAPPAENQGSVGVDLGVKALATTATACGGEGAGPARKCRVKPAPAKQASNGQVNYG